jgi:hypothetical protein
MGPSRVGCDETGKARLAWYWLRKSISGGIIKSWNVRFDACRSIYPVLSQR